MKKVVPYVHQELAHRFDKDGAHALPALAIGGDEQKQGGLSYKAPFSSEVAKVSLRSTGLYECGANLLWIDPDLVESTSFTEPSWKEVCVWANEHVPVENETSRSRILFPLPLDVRVGSWDLPHHFHSSLSLLGCHVVVYSWYLAVTDALHHKDEKLVQLLMEAARTVTVRFHLCNTNTEAIRLSLSLSERLAASEGLADTFLSFSLKILEHIYHDDDKVELPEIATGQAVTSQISLGTLQKWFAKPENAEVKFRGTNVHKGMWVAIRELHSFSAKSWKYLRAIEWRYGKSLLSNAYGKLARFGQVCGALKAADASQVVDFAFRQMLIQLEMGVTNPALYTSAVLNKNKEGKPGWLHTTCAKWSVMHHWSVVAQQAHANAPDNPILKEQAEWLTYLVDFLSDVENAVAALQHRARSAGSPDEEEDDDPYGEDEGQVKTSSKKQRPLPHEYEQKLKALSKASELVHEWFLSILAGDCEGDIRNLAEHAVSSALAGELKDGTDGGDLGAGFREWMRLMDKKAPPLKNLLRTLLRSVHQSPGTQGNRNCRPLNEHSCACKACQR